MSAAVSGTALRSVGTEDPLTCTVLCTSDLVAYADAASAVQCWLT